MFVGGNVIVGPLNLGMMGDAMGDDMMVTCTVTAIGAVNLRAAASTDSEVADSLADGDEVTVIGQTSVDGVTWWETEDRLWVREDVVSGDDACGDVMQAM